jgi:hypothetical protein
MRSTIRSLEGSVGAAVQDQLVSAPEQAVKGALGDGEHDFVRAPSTGAPCTGGRMNAAVPREQRLDGARDGLQGGRAGGVLQVHVAAGAAGDERDAGIASQQPRNGWPRSRTRYVALDPRWCDARLIESWTAARSQCV